MCCYKGIQLHQTWQLCKGPSFCLSAALGSLYKTVNLIAQSSALLFWKRTSHYNGTSLSTHHSWFLVPWTKMHLDFNWKMIVLWFNEGTQAFKFLFSLTWTWISGGHAENLFCRLSYKDQLNHFSPQKLSENVFFWPFSVWKNWFTIIDE